MSIMSSDSISVFVNDTPMFSIKPMAARCVYIPNTELSRDDAFLFAVQRLVMYHPEVAEDKIDRLVEASIRYATPMQDNRDEGR